MSWKNNRRSKRQAFSLIELMVVIAIIGLLAGVVAVNVRGNMETANIGAVKKQLADLRNEVELRKVAVGKYPTIEEQLDVLLQNTGDYQAKLFEKSLIDPWGNPFLYEAPGPDGEPYEIISLGADGREGGEGANRDFSHLELGKADSE